MIRFIIKIIFVFFIAMAAVIYHNTEAGRELEKRVGEELSFDGLKESGKTLFKRFVYIISLEVLDEKKESFTKEKVKSDKKKVPSDKSSKKGSEKILDDERERLEQIIEEEG